MPAAIELRDVHKTFRIPHEKHTTLTERVLSVLRPVTYERFEALRGVDLSVEAGAFLGVIGGNGSGKSTLLKIISGLLAPDKGVVRVAGTMSALLELGLGFSAELTVRENVELYAALLGYPRREVHKRVDEAIDFAGLERFRDAKLKNLSTGMRARLGFATALQADAAIMLLDEILAVGDADFQLKCLKVFEDLKQRRKTMLLVSHDLRQVQRFCDEAVWLREGRIAASGDPDAVIAQYLRTIGAGAAPSEPAAESGERRWGDGRMRVLRGWIENDVGKPVGRVRSGDAPTLVVLAEACADIDQPVLGLAVKAEDGSVVYADNTKWLGVRTELVPAGAVIEMRARFVAALRNGRYAVQIGIANRETTTFFDVVDGVAEFVVDGSLCRQGGADLHGRISYADLQGRISYRVASDPARDDAAGDAPAAQQQKRGVR